MLAKVSCLCEQVIAPGIIIFNLFCQYGHARKASCRARSFGKILGRNARGEHLAR